MKPSNQIKIAINMFEKAVRSGKDKDIALARNILDRKIANLEATIAALSTDRYRSSIKSRTHSRALQSQIDVQKEQINKLIRKNRGY